MAAPIQIGARKVGVGPSGSQIVGAAPLTASTNAPLSQLTPALSGVGSQPNGDYVDDQGTRWRQVPTANGSEWLVVTPSGSLVRQSDLGEYNARLGGTNLSGNAEGNRPPAGNPAAGYAYPSQPVAYTPRPVITAQGVGTSMGAPPGGYQQKAADILNDTSGNDAWLTGQTQRDNTYLGQLGGIVNGANQADWNSLNAYNTQTGQQYDAISALQAPTWTNYNSNPQDVARQQAAYDWASGAANGSLDYTAQQAGMQTANYQTYQAQQAALALAQLHQYASNPQDVQRQLSGLGNIEQDIATGGAGQRKILEQIYQDIQNGGAGQKDAIARLQQELATGGNDQREVMAKYKALSNPEVTAQERYLAEIARRSFEAQDRSSREAVLSDQAARGVRSGASEIASSLANQERFGQDRTLSELGLQANAVQRSMQALGGWQQSADSLRSAQQNGLAMYTQANNALRAAQQQGIALAANEENALRDAQQRGMAMYQQAADSIRAMNDQVGLANTGWANQNSIANASFSNQNSQFNANANNQANQFNANAYNQNSQFNANAYNMNQQFNANANNNAMANNQSTRVQGGVAMNTTANSIRSANDLIGMFNTSGAQTSALSAAQFGLQKQQTLGGISQQAFQNNTGVTNTNATRSAGLAGTQWSVPSATAATANQNWQKQQQDALAAIGFTGMPARPTMV